MNLIYIHSESNIFQIELNYFFKKYGKTKFNHHRSHLRKETRKKESSNHVSQHGRYYGCYCSCPKFPFKICYILHFKKSYLALLKVKKIYLTRFQPAQNRRSFNFSTSYSSEKREKIAPVFCRLTRFVIKELIMKLLSSASYGNFTNGSVLQISYLIN